MERGDYQEPPPPDPPPDDPPLEEPPLESLDGLDDIALWAEVIVLFINDPNVAISNTFGLSYQFGAWIEIDSNFFIHLSETPKT